MRASRLMLLGGGGPVYTAEARALFAAMSVQPSKERKDLYETLIADLKDGGLWDKLDLLYVLAAHDAQAARLNVKVPSTYALTAVAAPTFTADEGYQGNGSTQYLKTGFIPSTAGGVFVQDSAHIGMWSLTDVAGATVDIGGNDAAGTHRTNLLPRVTTGMIGRLNQTSSGAEVANASSLGHHVASRTSSTGTTLYARGSSLGNGGGTSTGVLASELYLLGNNNAGTINAPSTRKLAAAHVGSGLTAQNVSDLNTILGAWMTAVGA